MYKFLLDLNKELDEVRGRILATTPLLNIREAFAVVRREDSWKKLILNVGNSELEGSTLIV